MDQNADMHKVMTTLGPQTKERTEMVTMSYSAFIASVVDTVMRTNSLYKEPTAAQIACELIKEFPTRMEHRITKTTTTMDVFE